MNTYRNTISFWDNIFIKQEPNSHINSIKMHIDLENAIYWLINESKTILDYGCGSGTMLFKCAYHKNITKCLGIPMCG